MKGWTGKLLRVNLTTGQSRVEDIPQQWLRDYVGGRGVADRYLFEEMDPRTDPYAPENKLIFATGPYFEAQGLSSFYPHVVVTFAVPDGEEHHHVPLLVSPFGFTTYRGS